MGTLYEPEIGRHIDRRGSSRPISSAVSALSSIGKRTSNNFGFSPANGRAWIRIYLERDFGLDGVVSLTFLVPEPKSGHFFTNGVRLPPGEFRVLFLKDVPLRLIAVFVAPRLCPVGGADGLQPTTRAARAPSRSRETVLGDSSSRPAKQ